MSTRGAELELRTSPHQRSTMSVDRIMRNVTLALLPVCGFAVYNFGISALALLVVTTAAAVLTEHFFRVFSGERSTIGDWSAVVSGILLALILPPALPLWIGAVTAIIAVALGKMFFGGLGYNVMNPALVGRAFAQEAFGTPMTTWVAPQLPGRFSEFIPSTLAPPFMRPGAIGEWMQEVAPDGVSGATPLEVLEAEQMRTGTFHLLTGSVSGSTGETAALLILICGAYLVVRKMLEWRIPVGIFATVAVFSGLLYMADPTIYPDPVFMLFAGGLVLGAVFLATDPVSSPETRGGVWVYSIVIGLLVVLIRLFAGATEGVMYAILFANALTPLISRMTQPRTYGTRLWKRSSKRSRIKTEEAVS
ncbi:MAG: RnfABCDGE type electron transport complex subunit D [Spirochaetia bacterium]